MSSQPGRKPKTKIQKQLGTVAVAPGKKKKNTIGQPTEDPQGAARGAKRCKSLPATAFQIAGDVRVQPAEAYDQRILRVIDEIKGTQVTSYSGIARCLNERGCKTSNGKAFFPQTVKNLLLKTAARPADLVKGSLNQAQ